MSRPAATFHRMSVIETDEAVSPPATWLCPLPLLLAEPMEFSTGITNLAQPLGGIMLTWVLHSHIVRLCDAHV
jgi:hypothetical protein